MTLFNIRLVESDQQRLAAPDPLPFDAGTMSSSEAIALYKKAGFDLRSMLKALGERDPEARKAMTWLALRRAGVDVPYSELDFETVGWRLELEDDSDAADEAEGDDAEGNSGAPESGGPTPQP